MLTVPEAARRAHRDPKTIRRWIRSGKLRSHKVGTQHVIEESDLLDALPPGSLPLPPAWRLTDEGQSMPDVVALIRRSREGH
jgi:excisionase family DNA binding protein